MDGFHVGSLSLSLFPFVILVGDVEWEDNVVIGVENAKPPRRMSFWKGRLDEASCILHGSRKN